LEKWQVFMGDFSRHAGYCPICEADVEFEKRNDWLRDHLTCLGCNSIPRWRAMLRVLHDFFPGWRSMKIHESSPGGPQSKKLQSECIGYFGSHFYQDVPRGQMSNGYRSEDLEAQTFSDESFDLVVTSDVFEHVLDPAAALAEVARTLVPGGAHVFTIPWYFWKSTYVRAKRGPDGAVQHLATPQYHGNPIDSKGSLVVTEWGYELCDYIYRTCGLTTTAVRIRDWREGIAGDFIEVFISRKLPAS
jgi:SAM-dependent methyltransferase